MTMYDELTARVVVPNRPDVAEEGRRFWHRRFALSLAFVIVGIACIVLGMPTGLGLVIVLLLLAFVAAFSIRRRLDRKILVSLDDRCDPVGFMAVSAEALRKCPTTSMGIIFASNYGTGALYAGDFSQAATVGQYLHELSCRPGMRRANAEKALFYETILYAEFSLAVMDEDALATNLVVLSRLSNAHPGWAGRYVYGTLEYAALLKLYHDQKWDAVIQGIKDFGTTVSYRRLEVKRNYYLYRVYSLQGDEASAAAARDFVLANGGGLWYRTKLLSEPGPAPYTPPVG